KAKLENRDQPPGTQKPTLFPQTVKPRPTKILELSQRFKIGCAMRTCEEEAKIVGGLSMRPLTAVR
ncbi:MAG: hypothetical protein WB780_00830, partial [Candidatus Acidiferrales bacterium]